MVAGQEYDTDASQGNIQLPHANRYNRYTAPAPLISAALSAVFFIEPPLRSRAPRDFPRPEPTVPGVPGSTYSPEMRLPCQAPGAGAEIA